MIWKLGLAAAALFALSRVARAGNKCAGQPDYTPCGAHSKCLKGACVEFTSCATDPNCHVGYTVEDAATDLGDWLDPTTWFDLGSWSERLSEQLGDAGDAIREGFMPEGPITSPTDPRL